ncbi:MAG TPA: helix-turn-helix domain-containing protein [Tepidisphaeraceae bacterium]|nr:helix-turn-helix domain-containing protein [Tepidisphaeraceae bacterium]
MVASTFTMNGKRFVILLEIEYRRLRERRAGKGEAEEWGLPALPNKLASGNYPAVEYARAVTARDLIRARRRLGLSQKELAREAGVRAEVLNRIERAKLTASVAVMEKLDAALNRQEAGRGRAKGKND